MDTDRHLLAAKSTVEMDGQCDSDVDLDGDVNTVYKQSEAIVVIID